MEKKPAIVSFEDIRRAEKLAASRKLCTLVKRFGRTTDRVEMKMKCSGWLALCAALGLQPALHARDFVQVQGKNFVVHGQPYYYMGCNYWYGGILGSTGEGGNRKRLLTELDLMGKLGINNLRILAGAEGPNGEPFRVTPALVLEPGKQYDPALLDGLDFLLAEMGKRRMRAVLYLGNAWDWSGGFAQYLRWNGSGVIPYPMVEHSWGPFSRYVAQFYHCERCKEQFRDHIRFMLSRTNTCTGIRYIDDPTIMAWEIVNEPRPFGKDNIPAFEEWIRQTAAFIKSLDPHHLVTAGSEGKAGSEGSLDLVERVNADPQLDYMTMHVWPKNWGWINTNDIPGTVENAIQKTEDYMRQHIEIARKLNKPIVIEEYGLPRDHHRYSLEDTTACRDRYYESVFALLLQHAKSKDVLAGNNFWVFSGIGRPAPGRTFWKEGDDYLGDPPDEEQGLNSVFDTDTTTKLIARYAGLIEQAARSSVGKGLAKFQSTATKPATP
jgi:mannan endo-1,4-beta-mannosidase